jgi:hypothetical protein
MMHLGRYAITFIGNGLTRLPRAGIFQTGTRAIVDETVARIAVAHGNFEVIPLTEGLPLTPPVHAAPVPTLPGGATVTPMAPPAPAPAPAAVVAAPAPVVAAPAPAPVAPEKVPARRTQRRSAAIRVPALDGDPTGSSNGSR